MHNAGLCNLIQNGISTSLVETISVIFTQKWILYSTKVEKRMHGIAWSYGDWVEGYSYKRWVGSCPAWFQGLHGNSKQNNGVMYLLPGFNKTLKAMNWISLTQTTIWLIYFHLHLLFTSYVWCVYVSEIVSACTRSGRNSLDAPCRRTDRRLVYGVVEYCVGVNSLALFLAKSPILQCCFTVQNITQKLLNGCTWNFV